MFTMVVLLFVIELLFHDVHTFVRVVVYNVVVVVGVVMGGGCGVVGRRRSFCLLCS